MNFNVMRVFCYCCFVFVFFNVEGSYSRGVQELQFADPWTGGTDMAGNE